MINKPPNFKPFFAWLGLALWAVPSAAQAADQNASEFGCFGLRNEAVVPAMEGKGGVFFRIATDLTLGQSLSPSAVDAVARLSRALEAAGTTLIFAPVPTKAEAMPEALPAAMDGLEYSPEIAQNEYDASITALRANGVVTADILYGMREDFGPEDIETYGMADTPLFFRSDYHWTSEGARRAARQVAAEMRAQESYADLPKTTFETVEIGDLSSYSTMRRVMQTRCQQALPDVETKGFETKAVDLPATEADEPLDIFAQTDTQIPVVLLGTSFSDNPSNNFAGWIQQYSDLEVLNYAVTGGGQFGALLSYLTSDDFVNQHPAFIVWETPIYADIMQFGLGPVEELVAAADIRTCREQMAQLHDGGGIEVDLSGARLDPSSSILARFGNEGPRAATFVLRTQSGLERQYYFHRNDRLRATGNFWLNLGPYARTPLDSVRVTFDRPVDEQASLSLCVTSGD